MIMKFGVGVGAGVRVFLGVEALVHCGEGVVMPQETTTSVMNTRKTAKLLFITTLHEVADGMLCS
jgi:hypothetical protein